MLRYPIIDNDDWRVECEFDTLNPSVAIIHCNVYAWTHNKYKMYLDVWETIVLEMKTKGIARLGIFAEDGDSRLIRFALMFGFNIVCDVEDEYRKGIFMELELD